VRSFLSLLALAITAVTCAPLAAVAAVPCDSLLPETTKGFVATKDVDRLRDAFNKTQLGHLVQDEKMKPFIEDLRRQMKGKLSETNTKLGLTLDDLADVYTGEVCAATIQPEGDKNRHALVVIVDATGKGEAVGRLLAKIDRNMADRKAVRSVRMLDEAPLTSYQLPPRDRLQGDRYAHFLVVNEQLVASDDLEVMATLRQAFKTPRQDSLSQLPAYKRVMTRNEEANSSEEPHLRWFIEPFGYAEALRAASGGRRRRGVDPLQVLMNQGFTAVKGMGGFVTFDTGAHEVLHRTLIYAPPVAGAEEGEKYELSARMLDFGEPSDLTPPDWVPREVASYLSLTLDTQGAFYDSKTLVNEMAGDKENVLFDDVLDSIRDDEYGPQLDIREDIVANLGKRAVLITDYQLPIDPRSERYLVAVELIDHTARVARQFDQLDQDKSGKVTIREVSRNRRLYFQRVLQEYGEPLTGGLTKEQYVESRSVEKALNRSMETDPDARKLKVGDTIVWEIINDPQAAHHQPPMEEDEMVIPVITIDGPGFAALPTTPIRADGEESKPLLPNSAVTVAHGHIMLASHVDFVAKVLGKVEQGEKLAQSADFRMTMEAVNGLHPGPKHLLAFSRLDDRVRPTYELIRQGKMPESQSMLGKLLNRMLGPEDEEVLREQQVSGEKLPPYEMVRRYLGPSGIYMNVEPAGDGFFVTGVVLSKDMSLPQVPVGEMIHDARLVDDRESLGGVIPQAVKPEEKLPR